MACGSTIIGDGIVCFVGLNEFADGTMLSEFGKPTGIFNDNSGCDFREINCGLSFNGCFVFDCFCVLKIEPGNFGIEFDGVGFAVIDILGVIVSCPEPTLIIVETPVFIAFDEDAIVALGNADVFGFPFDEVAVADCGFGGTGKIVIDDLSAFNVLACGLIVFIIDGAGGFIALAKHANTLTNPSRICVIFCIFAHFKKLSMNSIELLES